MIGRTGTTLDRQKLDELCLKRERNYRQKVQNNIISKQNQITMNVCLPSEVGTSDQRFFGLPTELQGAAYDVWSHILDFVTDPAEVFALWKVSEIFRGILGRKYVESRLPEIVKLILDDYPNYLLPDKAKEDNNEEDAGEDEDIENDEEVEQEETDEEEEEEEDELIDDEVDDEEENEKLSMLLRLRLLSKQCKRSLEEYAYSNFVCKRPLLQLTTIDKLEKITRAIGGGEQSKNVDAFFPGDIEINERIIWEEDIWEGEDGDWEEFNQEILTFLKMVGKRVHSFSYLSYQRTAGQVYSRLREWVGLMPNLEFLQIFRMRRPRIEPAIPPLEDIEVFPRCPQLWYYREVAGVLPAPYVHRILEANPSIGNLKLSEEGQVRKHSPQVLEPLKCLAALKCCPDRSLLEYCNLPWMLKKLILDDLPGSRDDGSNVTHSFSSCELFRFLNQFKKTIQHLEVMIDVADSGGFLSLPNLKRLKWKHHESFKNINFLLYAKRLEKLDFMVDEKFMEDDVPLFEKYKRIAGEESESFLGKPVWDVLPCLESIRVTHLGTEESFEECKMASGKGKIIT